MGDGIRPYNYDRFEFSDYVGGLGGVAAGDAAADGELYTVTGEPVRLSSLWADRPIVLEFGSITCPIFTAKTDRVDRTAEAFSGHSFIPIAVELFSYIRIDSLRLGARDRRARNGAREPSETWPNRARIAGVAPPAGGGARSGAVVPGPPGR